MKADAVKDLATWLKAADSRLASAYARLGLEHPQVALETADAFLKTRPGDPAGVALWGLGALEMGAFTQAEDALSRAAAATPARSLAWAELASQRARALAAMGRWSEAEAAVSAVEALPGLPTEVRARIGGVLSRINLADRGEPHLAAASAAEPGRWDLAMDLGVAKVSVGDLEGAEAALERVIALEPREGRAHMGLADLKRWTPQTAHIERLLATRARDDLPPSSRAAIGHALFKELDQLDRTEEAWPHLVEANTVAAQMCAPWSATEEAGWINALRQSFSRDALEGRSRIAPAGPAPIFIVGLPRSGTTLVERILASHSRVRAMGELPTLGLLYKQASRTQSPSLLDAETVTGARSISWPAFAEAYQRETAFLAGNSPVVIDKMPRNIALAGAAVMAFPNARIVNLSRNPMDGLFGAYKVFFTGAEWSMRQEDLAGHYRHHSALVDHWRAVLGDAFVDVSYEALVGNPTAEIPRILAACGLEFEDPCMTPEKAVGAVSTASSTQVRRPINAQGVGAWKRYAAQLEPLRARLAATGHVV